MEEFLEAGCLSDDAIAAGVAARRVFPCFFGSALKLEGLDELLAALPRFVQAPAYGQHFSAAVYKVARDPKGERLTFLKITGGVLEARAPLSGQGDRPKAASPGRRRSARSGCTPVQSSPRWSGRGRAGVRRDRLTHTWPGEGLGLRPGRPHPRAGTGHDLPGAAG